MKIYIAGIHGMVGGALKTQAKLQGHEVYGVSSKELDLTSRGLVYEYMKTNKPDTLIIAAAKVGGIKANRDFPVEFLSINLQIQTNLLDAAYDSGVKKVLFLGSSCIYPKHAEQPIKESSLLSGPLEQTNVSYAIAKIAGVKLVDAYREQYQRNWFSAMPTNIYGPFDNFNIDTSHVIPGIIGKIYLAKKSNSKFVELWGDGTPLREFLYAKDLADACLFLLENNESYNLVNIGYGKEISIQDLAILIAKNLEYRGKIIFNSDYPNGTPRKLLDSSIISNLGWVPKVTLQDGINETIKWYLEMLDHKELRA